jgi:oxygen-independent coproporphyrinogen-3 oxidase
MIKSCYIHIPFCDKICSYCDFCKIFYNEKIVDKYLEELELEINDSYQQEILDTIYIGGGTPSSLNIKQLNKLFSIINNLNKSKDVEFTIECNFESINHEKLDLFKEVGINRLSFGIESINKSNLKILDREIDKNKVIDIINYAKNIGFNNINVDLMYALKDETIDMLKKDLEFIKSLNIEHISTYSLILEEHTKLYIDGYKYINDELDREMYDLICNELKDFDHYEISNFSKNSNYRSKHNMTYWMNNCYYGFGLGSSGYEGNIRYNKTRSITKYLNHDYMKDNGLEFLKTKDKVTYEVILNLRTGDGINLNTFKDKYTYDLDYYYDYKVLVNKGHLILEDDRLFIPKDLWYISNSIIVELLEME